MEKRAGKGLCVSLRRKRLQRKVEAVGGDERSRGWRKGGRETERKVESKNRWRMWRRENESILCRMWMEWSRDKMAGVTWREREWAGTKAVKLAGEFVTEHHSNRYLGERGRCRIDVRKVAISSKGSSKSASQAMEGRCDCERRSATVMSDDGSMTRLSPVSLITDSSDCVGCEGSGNDSGRTQQDVHSKRRVQTDISFDCSPLMINRSDAKQLS